MNRAGDYKILHSIESLILFIHTTHIYIPRILYTYTHNSFLHITSSLYADNSDLQALIWRELKDFNIYSTEALEQCENLITSKS